MKKSIAMLSLSLAAVLSMTAAAKENDYAKYVELGDYTGLETQRVITEVSDDELEYQIQNELELYADYNEITDRAAKLGDTVTIDFLGKVDGKDFDGNSDEDYELLLGSGSFIDGFEDQIVGMKLDEKKEIKVTFPEDYDGMLDGKEAVFDVTLKGITEITLPELNDDFVKNNTEYNTVAEYKDGLKADLQSYYDEDATYMASYELLSMIKDNAVLKDIPDDLMEEAVKQIQEDNAAFAEQFGMDIEELYGEDYSPADEAEEYLKEKMVIYAIADKENISVSDEEYEEFVDESWEYYDYESKEEFEKSFSKDEIQYQMLYDRVLEFLGKNNTFVDITEEEAYGDIDSDFEVSAEDLEDGSLELDLADLEGLELEDADQK